MQNCFVVGNVTKLVPLVSTSLLMFVTLIVFVC